MSDILAGYLDLQIGEPGEPAACPARPRRRCDGRHDANRDTDAGEERICRVGPGLPCRRRGNGAESSGAAADLRLLASNGVKQQPYLTLEQMVPFDIPPTRWENRGGFFPDLSRSVVERLAAAIARGPGIYDELSFLHLHGAPTRIPLAATAFPMRSKGFAYGIASTWRPATGPAQAAAWVDRTADELAGFGDGAYVNVMGREGPAAVRRAYSANYARLTSAKRKFDPTNLFAINQDILPTVATGQHPLV